MRENCRSNGSYNESTNARERKSATDAAIWWRSWGTLVDISFTIDCGIHHGIEFQIIRAWMTPYVSTRKWLTISEIFMESDEITIHFEY